MEPEIRTRVVVQKTTKKVLPRRPSRRPEDLGTAVVAGGNVDPKLVQALNDHISRGSRNRSRGDSEGVEDADTPASSRSSSRSRANGVLSLGRGRSRAVTTAEPRELNPGSEDEEYIVVEEEHRAGDDEGDAFDQAISQHSRQGRRAAVIIEPPADGGGAAVN